MAARARRYPQTDPRKEPTQDRARATVESILAATARILVKEGYEGATTNKIAATAGVGVGSLYQYFPSKEALVASLIDRHSGQMLAFLEARSASAPRDQPLREIVREVVGAMIEAHKVDPRLHRVLIEQVPRVGSLRRIEALDAQIRALIEAYLEQRRDEIRPRNIKLAVFLLTSTVEAITHGAVLKHPEYLADEQLIDETTELVMRYLA